MVCRKLFLAWAVIVLVAAAFAQVPQQTTMSAAPTATTNACQSTFTFGSGQTLFNFCISSNGNLVQFTSPEGFEHIREGQISEGYGICDITPQTGYFDYADSGGSGNWKDPIITQPGGANTFPLKITRTTSDGIFTLAQVFSRNTSERIARIAMTLKNNSGVVKKIQLLRFADIDANNAHNGDLMNEFDFGTDSAWGYNSFEYGLSLSTVPTGTSHVGRVWSTTSSGPNPCNSFPNRPPTPFFGDGSAGIVYGFTLAAGKSKTLSVEYQRF